MCSSRFAFPISTRRLSLVGALLAVLVMPAWPAWAATVRPAGVTREWDDDSRGDFAWAVVRPHDCLAGGRGVDGDWRRLRRLAGPGATAVWFRVDGHGWLVRDRALVGRAVALIEPAAQLGEEQGRVGLQQGELGARQGELGVRQAELGAMLAQLDLDDGTAASSRRERIRGQIRELENRERQLEREQRVCERRQRELDFRQRELERRITRDLHALAGGAIAGGRAVRLDTF